MKAAWSGGTSRSRPCASCGDKGLVLWVDLDNPTDEEVKTVLEGVFQFHPLAIEDCVTPSSLPKVEDYEDYLFMVMHAVTSRAARSSTRPN